MDGIPKRCGRLPDWEETMKKKYTALGCALALSLQTVAPVFAREDVQDVQAPMQDETMAAGNGDIVNESDFVIVDRKEDSQEITQRDAVAMYRLYNPNSGEHFYTEDKDEKNALVTMGWIFEGIGWYAPRTSQTPVYRLYNPNAGDHHYTIDENEKNALESMGWIYEKIGWYSDDANEVPVYRQYNPNAETGSHNYTVDSNENAALIKAGWNEEGIGWSALSLNCPPQSVIQELESMSGEYEQLLKARAADNLKLDDLMDKGLQITSLINALSTQFENRYFLFQNGNLVGYTAKNDSTIQSSGLNGGKVLVLQPRKKRAQSASSSADYKLQGEGLFIRSGSGKLRLQAAAGTIANGSLNGNVAGYTYNEDPNNAYEEMSSGPAADNLMNGHIVKHTHYLRASTPRMMDFDWYMDVENGTAKYEKIGDYYYVCHSPTINVYYDYIPQNLNFWPSN